SGVFYNPANLALRPARALNLGMGANFTEEMKTGGDTQMYSSSALYKGPTWGIMYPIGGISIAVGQRGDTDMGYYHAHKEFDEGYADSYETDITGGINRTVIATGFRLLGGLHTGFSYNLVGGGVEGDSEQILYQDSWTENEIDRKFSGNYMDVGLLYRLAHDAGTVGFNWSPGYEMEDDWSSEATNKYWDSTEEKWVTSGETSLEGKRDVTMPSKMGLGIQYNFLGLDQTMITADVERTQWSNYRYEETDSSADGYNEEKDPGYRDTTSFSVGAEHYITFATALRGGFSYEPFYGSTAVDKVSVSAGAGIDVGQDLAFDIGSKLGMLTYQGDNPFTSDTATVSERNLKLSASMEWSF
ncbi:MAG: OmpP1/FadL family transporter, partial [Elusimicrobiota bacterium]